jgi:sugar lactone lactonase YvrE
MKNNKLLQWALALVGAFGFHAVVGAQPLLVGDEQNDAVEAIDSGSGKYLGTFVHSSINTETYKISGPRGLIFVGDALLAANQNVDLPISGEILKFDAATSAFRSALVPSSDPNAPFAPHGIVIGPGGILYVADLGNFDNVHPGRVARYDAHGNFLGNLDPTGFSAVFYPRGMVFGPDGHLYVSVVGNLAAGDRASGYVVRFNSATGAFVDVVASQSQGLHRPEGLVFGPDGNLYVTSFLLGADKDRIMAFTPNGAPLGALDLYPTGAPRVFAQALLFGPEGDLFVPLTSSGVVRRYRASTGFATFTEIPRKGNSLKQPYFLTFGDTNPSTLAYEP